MLSSAIVAPEGFAALRGGFLGVINDLVDLGLFLGKLAVNRKCPRNISGLVIIFARRRPSAKVFPA